MMQKIGFIPNFERDIDLEITNKLVNWAIDNHCTPLISGKVAKKLGLKSYSVSVDHLYTESDFLVVLGGDGTILNAARNASIHDTPILGINLGTLGYLTDVEKNEAILALEKVLKGEYKLEKRMMLEATIISKNDDTEVFFALNEVCISKGIFMSIIELDVFVNNEYIDTYKADGLIISTPTGSTAYNLSAGGPILKPDGEMIAITPICPHAIYNRSSVISANDLIEIKIGENILDNKMLAIDGHTKVPLKNDDVILIKRSTQYTTIMKTNNLGFYDILRAKMVGVRK